MLGGMRNLMLFSLLLCFAVAPPVDSAGTRATTAPEIRFIRVFLPAPADSHPVYRQTVDAAESVAERHTDLEARVAVLEDPGAERIVDAAGDGRTALVVAAGNPLSESLTQAAEAHPERPFLMVDGTPERLENVSTLVLNRREQSFLAGYIAGLQLEGGTAGLLIESGVWAGERVAVSGFRLGLKAASAENELLRRRIPLSTSVGVVAARLGSFRREGISTVLPVLYTNRSTFLEAAQETEVEILWLDEAVPSAGRSRVLVSIAADVGDAAEELLSDLLEAGTSATRRKTVGFSTGAFSLNTDFDRFNRHFGAARKDRILEMERRLRSGDLVLELQG